MSATKQMLSTNTPMLSILEAGGQSPTRAVAEAGQHMDDPYKTKILRVPELILKLTTDSQTNSIF